MTAQIEAFHLELRRSRSEQILAKPEKYKVCDQCQSISYHAAPTCTYCHAYRWRSGATDVKAMARITGTCAFPLTAGVVPRIS